MYKYIHGVYKKNIIYTEYKFILLFLLLLFIIKYLEYLLYVYSFLYKQN